jgi:osomolarity two-component system response regulator SSK1
MMVQTLLQISPSQVFDPAKEQFSACSLSVPTPCMSAVFTSMKNLNYISANMAALCADHDSCQNSGKSDPSPVLPSTLGTRPVIPGDFDVGELLQSVGDTLSGAAAQAGVDLVLYHGDVGMKHVCVKGDECGISYALSHVSQRCNRWLFVLNVI